MPNGNDIDFKIPGRPAPPRAVEPLPGIARITVQESYQIRPPTRGAEDLVVRSYPPGTLLELEFENGARRYTRADQLASDLAIMGPTRGGPTHSPGSPVMVPAAWGGATRGDSELLAAFRVLDVTPWDPVIEQIAEAGAEFGAQKIAAYFEKHLNTGLYQVTDPRELTHEIAEPIAAAPDKPILLLLHGTASSTAGSFSGLAGKNEWKQFLNDYDRVLALEHHTFSVSPIQNAMDAARLLPAGATLHLLSHSRGGLIGELLCLTDIRSNQIADFKRRRPEQAEDLEKLAAVLREKQFQIERFVRVACPSRGTLLASDRLDLYFSLLLKVLELVPILHENIAYAVFKATFLKLIEMKAAPEHVPGIEAMRPESPLIALLNRPDLSTQADLAVIAGRTDGFTLSWRSVAKLASDAFYREANDFIVNTEAMYWGMHRKNGGFYFSDRGGDVSHFNYFKNDRTRKQAAAWLSRATVRPSNLFVDLTLRLRKDLMFPEWRGEEKRPVLIYVPPALGTYLRGPRGRVWLQIPGLLPGDLDELTDLNRLSTDGVVPYRCGRLLQYLNGSFAIRAFDYDWRQPLEKTAKALALSIREQLASLQASGRPVAILAFSSGGVLLGRMLDQEEDLAAELKQRRTRMVALGNPIEAARQTQGLADGSSELLNLLKFVDGRETAELAALFQQLPGITAFDTAQSQPADEIMYVVGRSPGSEAGMRGANVWYAGVPHGNLADHPPSFEAIRDLLVSGSTTRLSTKPLPVPAARVKIPYLYPTEAELFDAAFQAAPDPSTEPPTTINACVSHAHLRDAHYPVVVGHYQADVMVSAERVLDEQLGGRLSDRFHMDLYPGKEGTIEVVEAPNCSPPGALVIGLGEVGSITAEKVRNGITLAALRHALAKLEAAGPAVVDPIPVGITSVLLGTYGGNALSVHNSVAAIVDGVVQANRTLVSRGLGDRVRVDSIEIIELYEDLAIQAAHELVRLEERIREYADERVVLNVERYLRVGSTGQFHRPADPYASGWWRRIGITQKDGQFRFTSLTERARAEQNDEARQLPLVDDFVRETIATTNYDEDLSAMLFEVLLPNDVKDQIRDEASLVLVVDDSSAGYPWELLAQRTSKTVKPLAVSFGMLRQLATPTYRAHPRSSRRNAAFVVGNPETSQPPLPKAREEAVGVGAILDAQGYEVKLLKDADASARAVLTQLFAREYRILHLAGHGQYSVNPMASGLVLSGGKFLTSTEIKQLPVLPELVFLNCCYLGEQPGNADRARLGDSRPNLLAASLARQLIDMGVKAVIAAGWAVDDDAALTFATTFYKEMLGNNEKFGAAVLKARQETFRQHPGSNTWGAYQCYGNPDFSLSPPQDGQSSEGDGAPRYVARRECLDRLRSLRSVAHGAADTAALAIVDELARIESGVPHEWLDGEVLTAIGAVYGELKRFEQAIETYRRALADPKARQPFVAVEQLVNLLDRSAREQPEPIRGAMWDEAVKLLDGITRLGGSPERSALAGGLYKRIDDANSMGRDGEVVRKAIEAYDEAGRRFQEIRERPYAYAILNAIALRLVSNQNFDRTIQTHHAREVLTESIRVAAETRDIFDRAGEPDAMVILHLLEEDLPEHAAEIMAKYQNVMAAASPRERDSIVKQLDFLARRLPGDSSTLRGILKKLGQ